MGDYNQNRFSNNRGGDRFNRRDSGGGRRSFGGGGSGPREMFPAVCDDCGKDCVVPFKPSGNKPVFCSDCFEKQGGNEGNRNSERSDRNDFRKPSFERRENNRDDWGSNSFKPERRVESPNAGMNTDLKQQIDAINVKLNQILKALDAKPKPKTETASTAEAKPEVTETKSVAAKEESKPKAKKATAKKKKAE